MVITPLKLVAGVNVYVPSGLNTKTPSDAGTVVIAVNVKASPSVSVSFVATVPLTGVSSFVEVTSSTATGASLTGITVIVNVAVSHDVASHT